VIRLAVADQGDRGRQHHDHRRFHDDGEVERDTVARQRHLRLCQTGHAADDDRLFGGDHEDAAQRQRRKNADDVPQMRHAEWSGRRIALIVDRPRRHAHRRRRHYRHATPMLAIRVVTLPAGSPFSHTSTQAG